MLFSNQFMSPSSFNFASLSTRSVALEMINSDVYSDSAAKELWQRFSKAISNGVTVNLTGNKDELKAFGKWFRAETSIASDTKEYKKIMARINRLFDASYGQTKAATTSPETSPVTHETSSMLADTPENSDAIQVAIRLLKSNGYSIFLNDVEI